MPVCFSLSRIMADGCKSQTCGLNAIDEELCSAFGEKPHETFYFRNWYNVTGFLVAVGKRSLEDSEEQWYETLFDFYTSFDGKDINGEALDAQFEVVQYLKKNFVSSAWYEHK